MRVGRVSRTSDTPFALDHSASLRRKERQPKGYASLLAWFLIGFRAELPENIHAGELWIDRKRRSDIPEYKPVGGSVLGAPGLAEAFRAYIEDDPFGLEPAEYEGHRDPYPHYKTPMRAALAKLAGRGRDSDQYPFMARLLHRIAYTGDPDSSCASFGIIAEVREVYLEQALYRLFSKYAEEPPARIMDTPEKPAA